MKKKPQWQNWWLNLWATTFILLFLFPYLALIGKIEDWQALSANEWPLVFGRTFLQAFLSAFLSCLLGFFSSFGLLTKRSRLWLYIYLLPNIVPLLFVLVGLMNLVSPFPFGLPGIILVHVALNVGVVALFFKEVLLARVSGMAELAMTEGASRWLLVKTVTPYLKLDFFWAFLFVFSVCFSSFTVPLVVGGFRGTTIEVLIYNQVVQEGAWGSALVLSIIQMFCILILAQLLRGRNRVQAPTSGQIPLLATKWGRLFPTLVCLAILMGCGEGLLEGWRQLGATPRLTENLSQALFGTVFVAVSSGFLILLVFSALAYLLPHRALGAWLRGYVAPSAVIFAFALLASGLGRTSSQPLLWISFAVGLLMVPTLYRLAWASSFEGLQQQCQIARSLGANRGLIFWRIILPQVWGVNSFLAGLGALWACGDIAVSGILLGGNGTLALVIEALLSSYRLEVATLLVWLMVLVGLIVFLLFWSLKYVVGYQPTR